MQGIQVLINLAPLPCALRPFYFNLAPCALLFFYRLAQALGRYAKSPGASTPGLDVKEGPKPLDLVLFTHSFEGSGGFLRCFPPDLL
mgnify:FL=1